MSVEERERLLDPEDVSPYAQRHVQHTEIVPTERDPHPYHHSHSHVISQAAFRTTPARWYILFAFSYMGLVQGIVGNSWGPIASTMKDQFDWSESTTAMLAMWMSLIFVPGALLFPPLMSIFSMRQVVLFNTMLMALAGVLKILSATVIPIQYLIYPSHVTQIINGFCGAVPFSGVMYITVNWFPTKQRLLATGVVMASLNLGIGVPFLLGPALVPEPPTNLTMDFNGASTDNHTHEFYLTRLKYYLSIQGACMILTFILVLVYFPSRPKFAPTASAVTARLHIFEGLRILLRKWNFWLIVFVYALTSGVFNGYGLTMDVILRHNNISQSTSGYIGFAALLSSVPSNLFIGALGAVFNKHQKALNIGFLSLGTVCMTLFVMNIMEWVPRSMAVVWVSVVVGVMCITGVVPILFDMSTESCHPVSEELSSTVMVLGNQIMCDVFTGILQIHFEKSYLNYVLIMCFAMAVFLACLYRTSNVRLLIDYHSITVDQLDTRSIHQIRNAGVRFED